MDHYGLVLAGVRKVYESRIRYEKYEPGVGWRAPFYAIFAVARPTPDSGKVYQFGILVTCHGHFWYTFLGVCIVTQESIPRWYTLHSVVIIEAN